MEKDWTIAYLAHKAGVSRGMLGDIEIGKRTPSLETLYKIAEALGEDVRLLIGGDSSQHVRDEVLEIAFYRAKSLSPEAKASLVDFIDYYLTKKEIQEKQQDKHPEN
jgi:transcriptional regulator with XRE-family HTH domain